MRTIFDRIRLRAQRVAPAILALAAGVALAACGGDSASDALRVDVSTATPGPAPIVSVGSATVRQGGAFTVTVSGSDLPEEALLTFGTHTYRMGRTDDGGLWAAVGVDADEEPRTVPLTAELTDGRGEHHRLTATIDVVAHEFTVDRVELAPDVATLLSPDLVAEEERLLQRTFRGLSPPTTGDRSTFRMPVEGEITTAFGDARIYNDAPAEARDRHRGVDIGADEGTPVVASADGVVVYAGAVPVRGNYVILDHGLGLFTGYGHLSEIGVAVGQRVAAGATIGAVGSTGASTGPHLHWDIVSQGVFFDALVAVDGALTDGRVRRNTP